jgi:sterol desaturase/sphingolipid hydroxylase (fatty acid hydroxylase superfamily)
MREEVHLTVVVIVASLLAVALWEFCRPRRQREFPALRRRLGNLGIWLLNLGLASFTFAPPDTFRPQFQATFGMALPSWPLADGWLSIVAAFLLLDVMRYTVHRCEHAVPLFWRFHALHHSDPDVDVTTSVRHHPVESLASQTVYWLAAIVLNIPAFVVLGYAVAAFGMAAFQHGNIRLPERIELWLQPVLVTTDMHRTHHSVVFEQANSNYGAVLSVWDRLFGTYTSISRAQHNRIVFGVRELPRRDCLKPSAMLLTPWRIARVARATAREAA